LALHAALVQTSLAMTPELWMAILEWVEARSLVTSVVVSPAWRTAIVGTGGVVATRAHMQRDSCTTLARWRSSNSPLSELRQLEMVQEHFRRIAGVYFLGANTILEISPEGYFVNYGPEHRFEGRATVAAVVSVPSSFTNYVDNVVYLLDRWYTECRWHGRLCSADELPWVDENFRCFSASGLKMSEKPGQACLLLETKPDPCEDIGWDISGGEGPDTGRHLPESHQNVLRPLGRLAMPWPLACSLDDLVPQVVGLQLVGTPDAGPVEFI